MKASDVCSEVNNHQCEVCLNTRRDGTQTAVYSLTGETDRALCFQKHDLCFIHSYVDMALSQDNVDRPGETLRAGGTFHHVNETQWSDCVHWTEA